MNMIPTQGAIVFAYICRFIRSFFFYLICFYIRGPPEFLEFLKIKNFKKWRKAYVLRCESNRNKN